MQDLFSVKDKVILVTGSTRGLGRAFAEAYANGGATVIINGRSEETVAEAVEDIRQSGAAAEACCFDVADENAVREAIAALEKHVGRIDVLVNNAGIHRRAPLSDLTMDDWETVVGVNLNSVFFVSQCVSRGMIKRAYGKIINISSLNSIGARPTIANYCASKGGLNALTRSMATEWGKHNIQSNAIAPGYFITDMTQPLADDPEFDSWVKTQVPMGRWGLPEDLIGTALFLASRASDYVNGHVLVVDGGWTSHL